MDIPRLEPTVFISDLQSANSPLLTGGEDEEVTMRPSRRAVVTSHGRDRETSDGSKQ